MIDFLGCQSWRKCGRHELDGKLVDLRKFEELTWAVRVEQHQATIDPDMILCAERSTRGIDIHLIFVAVRNTAPTTSPPAAG